MNALEYINSSGKKVLEYYPPDSIMLDLPFILTQDRILTCNMPYMLLEKGVSGNHVTAIRLLDFKVMDGIIHINLQELVGAKAYTLTWNLDYEGAIWMWTIADYPTLVNL